MSLRTEKAVFWGFLCLMGWSVQAEPLLPGINGFWGTEDQCQQKTLLPNGTKRAVPFEVKDDWFRHGQLWCRLTPFPSLSNNYRSTLAACGEDSVQTFRLDFYLSADGLTMIWNENRLNAGLRRCD